VSLTRVVSKILEKIVRDSLMGCLPLNNLVLERPISQNTND